MKYWLSLFLLLCYTPLWAQHDSMQMSADTPAMSHVNMDRDMGPGEMNSAFSLNLPMSRNGSGTSWVPDASPVYAYMKHWKKWMLMLHDNVFARYTAQNVNHVDFRGENEFSFPNWFMGMAQRRIGGKSQIVFNLMLSFENLTDSGNGYPLLFQTGESWKGVPLVDRQHPHDLFSELSVGYTYSANRDMDVNIYVGYPGEPALGPPTFMHRSSAMANPDAPLGHHWQDATHITFGVATLGFRYKIFKLEGSIFNGREPDENRCNFDKARFDSYSARLSANPNRYLSLQASLGYIHSPEELFPQENITRATVSAVHCLPQLGGFILNSTLVLGTNFIQGEKMQNSFLAETNAAGEHSQFYLRYEFVQKDAQELNLTSQLGDAHRIFDIHAFTIGGQRVVAKVKRTCFALGAQMTVDIAPNSLNLYYGNMPLSVQGYLRIFPDRIVMVNIPWKMDMPEKY